MSGYDSFFDGLLYDRSLTGGSGEVKDTEIPLDGSSVHITQFNRDNNTRYSWETDGTGAHGTNQNVAKGSSGRHF